jgi:hypothetical protein
MGWRRVEEMGNASKLLVGTREGSGLLGYLSVECQIIL